MSKYKITIGDRVFDAESNGDGTFQMKNGNRDFTMSAVALDVLEAKIEKVEPLRFEADVMFGACSIDSARWVLSNESDWVGKLSGKKGKLTFVEELPAQCEHDYRNHDDSFYTCYQKCTKCGAVKQ